MGSDKLVVVPHTPFPIHLLFPLTEKREARVAQTCLFLHPCCREQVILVVRLEKERSCWCSVPIVSFPLKQAKGDCCASLAAFTCSGRKEYDDIQDLQITINTICVQVNTSSKCGGLCSVWITLASGFRCKAKHVSV